MAKVHAEAYAARNVEIVTENPNIVSICTPDYLHGQQVIDALNAGCHVMCEKPLCTKLDEFDQIEAMLPQGRLFGPKLCVNYPLRLHPPFTALGRIPIRFAMKYHYGRRKKLETGWRADACYSEVMGGMIHMLDLAYFVTGQRMHVDDVQRRGHTVRAWVTLERGAKGKFTNDFSQYKDHYHKVSWTTEGGSITVINRCQSDKKREILSFITHLQSAEKFSQWSSTPYFHPTRVGLRIDSAN